MALLLLAKGRINKAPISFGPGRPRIALNSPGEHAIIRAGNRINLEEQPDHVATQLEMKRDALQSGVDVSSNDSENPIEKGKESQVERGFPSPSEEKIEDDKMRTVSNAGEPQMQSGTSGWK